MRLWISLFLLVVSMFSVAEIMPTIHTQSFADAPVDLPADLHGNVGILVIGFSKKSSQQTKLWNEALSPDYSNDPHFVYYEAAVLADVPSLLRGVILKGIRNQMALAERAHFIPILQDAAKWRDATHYASPDEAYVLLIDGAGQIQYRAHGAPTSETYSHVKEWLATLRGAR